MAFRKFAADKIFDGYRFLENHVLILASDDTVEAILPLEDAGEGVENKTGLLTPGFINCHCHLELSHMKGKIPEKTGLVDFVFKVVNERSAPDEVVAQAIAEAEQEMKKNGVVAVGDICNNSSTLSQKRKRNLRYHNFIEASGWLPSVSEARLKRATDLLDMFQQLANESRQVQLTASPTPQTPNCSIVPHAPYSVSDELWKRLQPYFQEKIVSIHNQETIHEDEFFRQGTGDFTRMYKLMKIDNLHHIATKKSSLQSYYKKLSDADKIILVHNTFTKQEDIDFIDRRPIASDDVTPRRVSKNKSQTFFCLCVNANRYIEGQMPPVELLRKNNCNIVLGTDSLASNRSLDILEEIKTIRKHFPTIPLQEMLRWATVNGATALNMADQLGSFEKGKKPGVVLIDEEGLEAMQVLY